MPANPESRLSTDEGLVIPALRASPASGFLRSSLFGNFAEHDLWPMLHKPVRRTVWGLSGEGASMRSAIRKWGYLCVMGLIWPGLALAQAVQTLPPAEASVEAPAKIGRAHV